MKKLSEVQTVRDGRPLKTLEGQGKAVTETRKGPAQKLPNAFSAKKQQNRLLTSPRLLAHSTVKLSRKGAKS
jgi:hypothetical protein